MAFPNPRTDNNSTTSLEFMNAFVRFDVEGNSLVQANLDEEEVRQLLRLKLGDLAAGQVVNVLFRQTSPPASVVLSMGDIETALGALGFDDKFTAELGFQPGWKQDTLVGALWVVARAALSGRGLIGTQGYS